MGAEALARRLDRFLIKAPLMASLNLFHQWVGSGGISDHSPIFLEIRDNNFKPLTPFKFNSSWLPDASFRKLVVNSWTHCRPDDPTSPAVVFSKNLACIKSKTIIWAKEKRRKDEADLLGIEVALKYFEASGLSYLASVDSRAQLIFLELERIRLLCLKEEH